MVGPPGRSGAVTAGPGERLSPAVSGSGSRCRSTTAAYPGTTTIGAWRIVGRSLKSVDAIRAQLRKITSTDLGHRVPVPEPHDEIHELACTVNQTLALLEAALQRERRFTSDASRPVRCGGPR